MVMVASKKPTHIFSDEILVEVTTVFKVKLAELGVTAGTPEHIIRQRISNEMLTTFESDDDYLQPILAETKLLPKTYVAKSIKRKKDNFTS